jgi:pimeloyl-ACP methyl ester carboxylesterase
MKAIYFHSQDGGQQANSKKVIGLVAKLLATAAPGPFTSVAARFLMNPYSVRDYQFDELVPDRTYYIDTKMGPIATHFFSGGEKHILITHGWADTSKSFIPLIQNFLQQGFSVWCFDHIGHGQSFGNSSHLFGFIDGLEQVIEHIESLDLKLDSILAHSMGGAAVLNLDRHILENKKIIMISIPITFFEDMFKRIGRVGIPDQLIERLLERISLDYQKDWKSLCPKANLEKLHDNFFFVHDVKDRFCLYQDIQPIIEQSNLSAHISDGLGHTRILKDPGIIREITNFIKKEGPE